MDSQYNSKKKDKICPVSSVQNTTTTKLSPWERKEKIDKININYNEAKKCGEDLVQQGNRIEETVKKYLSLINTALKSWEGTSAQQYKDKLSTEISTAESSVSKELKSAGNKIVEIAKTYRNNEIKGLN